MTKRLLWLAIFILALATACTSAVDQAAEEPQPEPATATPVLEPVAEPTEPAVEPPAEESGEEEEPAAPTPVVEEEEETAGELPPLPALPANPAGGGFGGGGGPATGAETTLSDAPLTEGLMLEPFDIFSGTTFLLNTELPAELAAGTVWRNPEVYPSLEQAVALAQKLGFPLPLYQDVLPAEVRDQVGRIGEGVYRMPFYAFRGEEWLTITSGSAFYENRAARPDQELIEIPFEQLQPLAEGQIAAWGGLDFEYVLVDEGFGNVSVKRLLNGQPVDFPELFFHFNSAGELTYASYNVLGSLSALGDYPLISPAAAWEQILGGVVENEVWFSYVFDPNMAIQPLPMPVEPFEYQFWERQYAPGEAATLYGYPQVFLPVQDDSLPVVTMNQYRINGPAEELIRLVTERPNQVMISGTIGPEGRTFDMTGWEAMEDTFSPLFLEGIVSRQEAGVLLETIDGQTYLLPDAPADLEDGLEVFVFAWQSSEAGDASFPVLDWVNIDKKVDFGIEPGIAEEGESIAPEEMIMPAEFPVITEVVIDEVSLGYVYVAQWPAFDAEAEYVQPEYDMPAVLLQPFWQFEGTNDSGERMRFSVPAVDPAFFEG